MTNPFGYVGWDDPPRTPRIVEIRPSRTAGKGEKFGGANDDFTEEDIADLKSDLKGREFYERWQREMNPPQEDVAAVEGSVDEGERRPDTNFDPEDERYERFGERDSPEVQPDGVIEQADDYSDYEEALELQREPFEPNRVQPGPGAPIIRAALTVLGAMGF